METVIEIVSAPRSSPRDPLVLWSTGFRDAMGRALMMSPEELAAEIRAQPYVIRQELEWSAAVVAGVAFHFGLAVVKFDGRFGCAMCFVLSNEAREGSQALASAVQTMRKQLGRLS